MSDQPQIQTHYIKMIPEPEEPTFTEYYVVEPLEFIVETFFKFSFGLFCFAVIVDIIENL